MNIRDLLVQAPGHVLTSLELRQFISPHRLAALVGKGVIRYDGRGTYALPSRPAHQSIARQLKGVLSHRSAALELQLQLAETPTVVDVTVDPHRSNVPACDDVHLYYRRLREHEHDGGVTTIVRTILDCARDLPVPEALVIADYAVSSGRADHGELVAAAARLRGPRSGKARQVIAWTDPRAASALESVVRGTLLDGGIAGFEPQFPVMISSGRVLHADLGHREARVLIEAESVLAHAGADKLDADSFRYAEFAAAGYRLLRFTWRSAMDRRPWMITMVRNALAQRDDLGRI